MTIEELYKKAKNELKKAGIEDPAFDALCLIQKVFSFDRARLIAYGNTQAKQDDEKLFLSYVSRRAEFEPLQYILGSWSFMGYDFNVGEGVLIPREDTSEVVSLCIEKARTVENPKILDLCSGSGAIAVLLSKEIKNADVTAVEKSEKAFSYLSENIRLNNAAVKAICGDIFKCMNNFKNASFDIIVSNPPYIKSGELDSLQKEVQREPALALDGGADGYDFYRFIISNWTQKLKPKGSMAFELGENQFDTVKELMKAEKFTDFEEKIDLGNTQRAIIGTLH
ncbi:MAG: peptide chain release factor N(5)-glutamine methyltransferase [Ruminococcus sp.]